MGNQPTTPATSSGSNTAPNFITNVTKTIASITTPAVRWEWLDDGNVYKPYDANATSTLETAYQRYNTVNPSEEDNDLDLRSVLINRIYKVDLASMSQTNINTGKVRTVKRTDGGKQIFVLF